MRLVNADALATKLRHMGYMDENEEVQEVIDRFAGERGGDMIYRQAAIDACLRVRELRAYDEIEEIKALPSVQPERKTGKWLVRTRHEHYPSGKEYQEKVCLLCGRTDHNGDGDYCGYCGAKMEGEQDNE